MMIKRKVDKIWFPWWPEKWLWGTIRIECTPAERGIWVDLLSLASKDDGHIRANEETPYPLQQLAGMLIIPEKELEAAINKFVKMGKLTKTKEGTLYVTKWEKYQFSDRWKRKLEAGSSEITEHASSKEECTLHNTIKNNIKHNNKEKQNINLTREQEILIDEELKTVKGIGEKKRQMIICYLRELSIEFPDIDYVFEMRKKCTWWLDNPLNKKSNVHLQIRNWFNIVQKGFTEAKRAQGVGKDARGHKKSKYPMLFLNAIYNELRKQGKDNEKYSKLLFDLSDEEAEQAYIRNNDSPAKFIKFLEEKK